VSKHEHEGLVARIRQIRRADTSSNGRAGRSATDQDQAGLHALEARIAYLEQLVQGLQDSVHRESRRQDKRIAELEARIQPASLVKALSEDARERGL
jgi:hypothetical protein